jgi:hypothetical protein
VAIAIVAGALANKPQSGGEAWVRLNWVLGLRRLGFDVWFVEGLAGEVEPGAVEYFEEVVGEFGLGDRAALLDGMGQRVAGVDAAELSAAAAESEVLFNLSGHLGPGPLLSAPRRRVYVDLDPGFTQAWHADPAVDFELGGHDRYVTVGLNVGTAGRPLPAGGIEWIPTLPPIVLDQWPAAPAPSTPLRFTTVATWRSPYGSVEIDGREAPLKHHEFRRLLSLPAEVPEARFELALDIHPGDAADLEALRGAGWEVVPPREVAATPAAFREYLCGSGAEFSVAQGVYVASRSGWFSDRTAAYLASGRPALVQDTGVEDVPLGKGLLTFSSLEEAAEGARCIAAEPAAHAAAARRLAEEHLDSDLVLGRLLDRIGVEA